MSRRLVIVGGIVVTLLPPRCWRHCDLLVEAEVGKSILDFPLFFVKNPICIGTAVFRLYFSSVVMKTFLLILFF